LYTKPEHHDVVRRFIKSLRPPLRLTMPALETLAVISYKQPVTAPEIQEIRGVNTSGVLKTLLDKRLITTAGRKEVIGRPILYRTSKEFLMRFGLSDLQELPSLKEFEALAREALGTDEGVSMPGAGDESVLDGMPERIVEGEAAEVASETREVETAVSAESLEAWAPEFAVGATSPAELVRAQAENVAAAEEVFAIEEQYSEPTPALQTPAEEAAGILVESVREPAAEAAKEIEEKSHKAVAGE
jgi:segregation and condensation protein B